MICATSALSLIRTITQTDKSGIDHIYRNQDHDDVGTKMFIRQLEEVRVALKTYCHEIESFTKHTIPTLTARHLERKEFISLIRHGTKPLHWASFFADMSCIQNIVEKNITDTNAMDNNGNKPLNYALIAMTWKQELESIDFLFARELKEDL